MATKYLSYEGLQKYHALLMEYVDSADAKALKDAKIEEGILELFRMENPEAGAAADISLNLPEGGDAAEVITDAELEELFGVDPDEVLEPVEQNGDGEPDDDF